MKLFLMILLPAALLFSLTACAGNADPASEVPATVADAPTETTASEKTPAPESAEALASEPTAEPEAPGAKALVVYFSWSGNTEAAALEIQRQTGADVFEIVPSEPYTDDYNTLLDIAQQEQRGNARPAISGSVANMDGYDTIYLGYPNWWGDMPMIIYSFLDHYDLSGKVIAPFCTSGGSGLSDTVREIQALEPAANVLDGLHIGSSSASNASDAVTNWLNNLGLTE